MQTTKNDAELSRPLSGHDLTSRCASIISGRSAANGDTVSDAGTQEDGARTGALIRGIIDTKALTLRDLKAKAALYLAVPSDALADALALDIMAITH